MRFGHSQHQPGSGPSWADHAQLWMMLQGSRFRMQLLSSRHTSFPKTTSTRPTSGCALQSCWDHLCRPATRHRLHHGLWQAAQANKALNALICGLLLCPSESRGQAADLHSQANIHSRHQWGSADVSDLLPELSGKREPYRWPRLTRPSWATDREVMPATLQRLASAGHVKASAGSMEIAAGLGGCVRCF